MSLESILSDIQENVKNIDTDDIIDKNIKIQSKNVENSSISLDRISQETLNKINDMFNLLVLQSNIKNLPRVDYSIATEIFTMLPNISKTEKAKLTSSPSVINKEVLNKILSENVSDSIDASISNKLNELKTLIEQNITKFNEVYSFINSFKEMIKEKVELLNTKPALVIEYKKSENKDKNEFKAINLFTEKIQNLIYLDDTALEYEKYSNALTEKYRNLYNDETLKELNRVSKYFNPSELSLSSFIIDVNNLLNLLQFKKTVLENYLSALRSVSDLNNLKLDNKTIDYINNYNNVVDDLEFLIRIYNIINIENNCFIKVANLINFLD